MIRKHCGKIVAIAIGASALAIQAHAAVPAEVTTLFTDLGTVWDDVKEFVIGVVAFFVIVALVKRVRRG